MINKLTNEKSMLESKIVRLQGELEDFKQLNDKISSQVLFLLCYFSKQ